MKPRTLLKVCGGGWWWWVVVVGGGGWWVVVESDFSVKLWPKPSLTKIIIFCKGGVGWGLPLRRKFCENDCFNF